MATLKEIAEKVGVSVAAVSRVLNNDSGILVSDETKMEIFKVAEELQYKTVKQRKGKKKKENTVRIGIVEMYDVTKQLEDPYYLLLRNIVEKECFKNDMEVTKLYKNNDKYEFVGDGGIDGIIAIGKFSEEEIQGLKENTENIVFVDSSPDDERYDGVKINFKLGVKKALSYFIELGHRKIGFMGTRYTLGDTKIPSFDDRLKFYCEYMNENSLLNENFVIDCDMTSQGGYLGIKEFLKENSDIPTAFFVANDAIATGVVKGLQENGIEVPKDVSIIGFNDTIISQYMIPPLTSVRVHIEHLGEVAVQLMSERLNNRAYSKKVIIPSEFIIRESVNRIETE